MHFIHGTSVRKRWMSEWESGCERVQEGTWQANMRRAGNQCKRGFESERHFEWEWPRDGQPVGQETHSWTLKKPGKRKNPRACGNVAAHKSPSWSYRAVSVLRQYVFMCFGGVALEKSLKVEGLTFFSWMLLKCSYFCLFLQLYLCQL